MSSRRLAATRLEDPQNVALWLAGALTISDLTEALLSIAAWLEASAGVVYLTDRAGKVRLQGARGAARWARRHPMLPPDAPIALATAIATGTEMFAETRAEIERRHPMTASIDMPFQAEAVLPLITGGRVMGVFALGFDRARRFPGDERHWLARIAAHAAIATDRVRLIEDLSQSMSVNDLLVGMLAHDLRQPLNAVSVSAALLASRRDRDGGPDVRTIKAQDRIMSSADRMSRMIDQLLDFSRLRLGTGLPLEPATSDLAALVAQITEELRDGSSDATAAVEVAGDTRGNWDADRLGQVISNLLGNAVQHGRGGAAGVRARIDGTDPDVVRLSVHNAGAIAGELLPGLFDPLTAGSRRRGRARGLGLGLYIAREIVAAHGGQLTVTSNETDGTTFTVSLPRVRAAPIKRRDPDLLAAKRGGIPQAFAQAVKPATTTASRREPRPSAPAAAAVLARIDDVRAQLELRRLELMELLGEADRRRAKFVAAAMNRRSRSRTRSRPAAAERPRTPVRRTPRSPPPTP